MVKLTTLATTTLTRTSGRGRCRADDAKAHDDDDVTVDIDEFDVGDEVDEDVGVDEADVEGDERRERRVDFDEDGSDAWSVTMLMVEEVDEDEVGYLLLLRMAAVDLVRPIHEADVDDGVADTGSGAEVDDVNENERPERWPML